MNQQELDHLRYSFALGQGWTICYCSSRSAAMCVDVDYCADCAGWLHEHSPRIAAGWRWFVDQRVGTIWRWGDLAAADAAEADDRAYFGLRP
jgi:hypothetical protein